MKKILIIEDEKIMLNLLRDKLEREGYDVSIAHNGEEGLEKMKEVSPDIILLDIIMPKMGGFEVMEEMAKSEKLKNIPVIVISNSGQPVELEKVKNLGARDWLIKTEFDPQEVLQKVKKQLGD